MKGDPDPVKKLWVDREDASLTNPQGSVAVGWDEIAEAMDRAASTRRDGKFLGFEIVTKRVTDELAYVVEVEHLASQGSRSAGDHPGRPAGHHDLRTRRGARGKRGPPPRGSDKHP